MPARDRLVRREAMFGRLSECPPGGVVLVCAPAGSGKTVLLRSWVDAAAPGEGIAWIAVERGEQDAGSRTRIVRSPRRGARSRGRALAGEPHG
jgi:ATP/maltotriose-dependent transcriptional regulator MalT